MGLIGRMVLAAICTAAAVNFGWAGFWVWLAGAIIVFMTKRPGQFPAIAIIAVTGFIASFQADGRDVDINFGSPEVDVDGDGFFDAIGGLVSFIGWGWLLFAGVVTALVIRRLARPRA